MTDAPRLHRIRRIHGVISTDDILPARYKHSFTDPKDLGPHVFENVLPGLASTIGEGDALLGDDTFGIGSSREQAVSALIAAGVRAVLAPSFGRIFFRNAWNLSLPALELDADLPEGTMVEIDLSGGTLDSEHGRLSFTPVPDDLLEMVAEGGLLARVRRKIQHGEHARV